MILKIGHDVADDMHEAGMKQVTMVQRNRTCKFVLGNVSAEKG
jgi:cation diffusion facilitator CzcD-associated flavoprotein CzcO